MERDCGGCHSLAIGDRGGRMTIPHGDPARAIAAIETYFGRAAQVSPPPEPRRRPGVSPEAERTTLTAAGRASGPAQAGRAIQSIFSPGGLCADCHQVSGQGRAFSVAKVGFTDRYLVRGGFDHRTEGHRPTDPGALPCAGCHAAQSSAQAVDLLIPHIGVCAGCHGKVRPEPMRAAAGECSTCHSYHAPRLPAPKAKAPVSLAAIWK
jgi:predicted CXXCH cytochrome family protein